MKAGLPDLDDQTGLHHEFVGVSQAKIDIRVAGTALHFDIVNEPFSIS